MFSFDRFVKNEKGDLATTAISITVFLIVVAYILAPVGLTAMNSTDRNASGVGSGTTAGNIWDALVPVVLATLIIAVVYFLKREAQ